MPAPKPLSAHLREGTFRADRHAQPSMAAETAGDIPRKPSDLNEVESEHWHLVIEHRGPWLAESDGPALRALCELWSLRQKTLAILADKPDCKVTRTAFASYHDQWQKLAAKFGITPTDRPRMGDESELETRSGVRNRRDIDYISEKFLQ